MKHQKESTMKRSEINQILRRADDFIRARGLYLPPFAYWTPEDWRAKGPEVHEIVENRLGWDITDFGRGDFERIGLFLFTVRNGHPLNWERKEGKLYAEKLLIAEDGQVTPYHFHWTKMEDIINRGGGNLGLRLYNATPDDRLADTPLTVSLDGVECSLAAGSVLRLEPGQSITLPPRLYHSFWAEGGRTLIGEVSLVNDDSRDNRFLEPGGRFPSIIEDEPPLYLLCTDYERYYGGGHA
jgi:D-lyxose ketol-isomerase